MSDRPSAGDILIGMFMFLCGLCLTLVGGGCSMFWIVAMFRGEDWSAAGILMLLVSLATFAAGAVVLWAGGKVAFGKM